MLLTQDKFYYKYGIKKSFQLLEPTVINISTIALPYYSSIHMLNVNDDYYPTRQYPLLKNIHDAFILSFLRYEPMLHEVSMLPVKEREYVKALNKKYVDFTTYTRTRFNHILVHKKTLLKKTYPIFIYKDIDKYYRYVETKLSKIYRFENKYATIVKNVKIVNDIYKALGIHNNDFKQYLVVEIPRLLYDYSIINRFITKEKKDMEYLKVFHNETYMLLLEIFKLLHSKATDSSILKDLKKLRKVDIIFKNKQAAVIVNLHTLINFNKNINKSGSFNDSNMIKYMIHMFNAIVNSSEALAEEANVKINSLTSMNNIDTDLKNKLIETLKEAEKNDDIDKQDIANIINNITDESDNIVSHINTDEGVNTTLDKIETEVDTVNVIEYKNKYDELPKEEIVKKAPSIEKIVDANLKELVDNGMLDKKKYKKLMDKVNKILNAPSPFKDGTKIKDNLDIKQEELKIAKNETKLPDVEESFNKEDLYDPTNVRNKKYLKNIYKKDILSSIVGIQGSGIIVEDIEVTTHRDNLSTYEEYNIKLNDLGRSSGVTIKLLVPKVDEDGIFTISGNKYRLRQQRTDIVIKKINYNRVSLSTAYGKLFVDKAPYKKLDRGYDLRKKLLKLVEENKINSFTSGNSNVPEVKLPSDYTLFGRYVKSFKKGNYYFNFNYKNRKKFIKDDKVKLDKVENNGEYVVCGYLKNDLLVMDKNNVIFTYKNGKYNGIGTIWDIIELDPNNLKKEYSMVKIYKNYVPVVYLLTYYMGFKNMAKTLGVKYELLEGNKRVDTSNGEVVVKLEGQTLVMHPNTPTDSMILEGFKNDPKILKQMTFDMLNNKEQTMFLFKEMGLNLLTTTEIKALENLFIDPVSKTVLEEMGEPTTFIGLLIRASEMLVDDNYIHPNSLKGYTIKGYERIPQAMYKILVTAIKKKMNADTFGRSKIEVDPYAVWRYMNEDNSGVLVDDINPIAYIKQKEDTTMLGEGGRSKDTVVGSARAMHEDDVGVISESSKDSSDVGITAYLSANPKLKDIRGIKDSDKKLAWSNVLSTSAMLAPFSTMDDPKRVLYINIQNSHIVPIEGAEVYPVRTGYDAVFPYRVGSKYVGVAEDDGKVLKVGKNKITVEYKKLGKKIYKFSDWTSKEESNTSYIHHMVTNLKEDEKIVKDDILYYDKGFFDVDMFNPHRVVYRASTNTHIALMEISETYEDSILISDRLSKKSKIDYVKVRDIIMDANETITNVAKVGEHIDPNDPLLIIATGIEDNKHLSEETLDLLKGFVKTTPKAKYKGTLIKIKMYYNCKKKDLSRSLKKLADISEEFMEGKTGEVNSSYSIKGKPLEENKVHIKFYIKIEEEMHAADKGIVANQLKTTVANMYTNPIVADDGTNIDAIFSLKGIYARIVNSSFLMGTTASILEVITEKAVDMYFNKD